MSVFLLVETIGDAFFDIKSLFTLGKSSFIHITILPYYNSLLLNISEFKVRQMALWHFLVYTP